MKSEDLALCLQQKKGTNLVTKALCEETMSGEVVGWGRRLWGPG